MTLSLAVLTAAAPAFADGTGGVNLTVNGGGTAFHLVAAAHQTAAGAFTLTNVTGSPQSVELYAATAAPGRGGYSVGGPGSAPWIALPTREVTLAPHAHAAYRFTVARDTAPWGQGMTYGAVVLAVQRGNVVARVATLIYFDRIGAPGVPSPAPAAPARVANPLPPPRAVPTVRVVPLERVGAALIGLAGVLVAASGAGVALLARRRRREASLAAAPENTPTTAPALR